MKIPVIFKRIIIKGARLTTLFSLLIFYSVGYGNNSSIQPMPESKYAEFLSTAAVQTKANYENISTWQGEMSIQEDNYFYNEQCRRLQIDANDPSAHSDRIKRSVSASVKFATDIKNNRLYTEFVPAVKYTSLDLSRDVVVKEKYSPIISIVTSDKYLSYKPNHTYNYDKDTVINGKLAGRKALRLPLEKVKGEEWGHIRDPRKHFFSGNKTIWEELYSLRDLIVNPPNDIPYGKAPQINITTEKIEDYNLIHIKGGFHSSSDCINCENSFVNIVLTLDSSVAFNLVHREVTNKAGQILQTLDITYERVGHIYVPKSVNFIAFGSSDQNLIFYSQLTFTKSILNLPIPEEMFNYGNLGLKDEDRFKDEIADKEFIYQNDKLVEVAKKKSEDYRIVENEANGKSRVILEQSDAEVKMKTAMRTFAKAINEKDIETLKELLKNDIWQVRFRSLQVLEAFLKDDKQSLKEAAKSLENDENTSVQEKAKSILSKIDINKPNSEPQK